MTALILLMTATIVGRADDPPSPADAPEKPNKGLLKKADAPPETNEQEDAADKSKEDADEPPAPETDRPIPKPGDLRPSRSIDDWLEEDLEKDLEAPPVEDANPVDRIAQQMREAEELLAQLDEKGESVKVQEQILADIEKLLQQAKNPPPPGGGGSSQKKKSQQRQQQLTQQTEQRQNNDPSRGDPTDRIGPPRSARDRQEKSAVEQNIWGHLSEVMRAEMGQYAKENFLAKYRDQIERYYTQIARRASSGAAP